MTMKHRRPNILWLMSDQHNAACLSCEGHPDVRTPNLDRLAQQGVRFSEAFCNSPICGPSRVSMISGQYMHTTGVTGNNIFHADLPNPGTLPTYLRQTGYQTALVGKGHMIGRWDREGYEHIRYSVLCDADPNDPTSCHYFDYLVRQGLGDAYDLGTLPRGHPGHGMRPFVSRIPLQHSVEQWTGDEALTFLRGRDRDRPFFLQVSFQRPHDPYAPSPERAGLYDPDQLTLPASARDLFERRLAGKPRFQRDYVASHAGGGYPFVPRDEVELRQQMAHYFALVTVIDEQIGRLLDELEANDELDNTVICYLSDHGDFAGEHGLALKNLGIYESIHRVPLLLAYPGGPSGKVRSGLVELVDLYPTLCELAGVKTPTTVEGQSLVELAELGSGGKSAVVCEWDFVPPQQQVYAIRTPRHRLVHYGACPDGGELYDRAHDPDELNNCWDKPDYLADQLRLTRQVLSHVGRFRRGWGRVEDERQRDIDRDGATYQLHKQGVPWSELTALGDPPIAAGEDKD